MKTKIIRAKTVVFDKATVFVYNLISSSGNLTVNFSKEKVAQTVKEMSELMNCDYKMSYEEYTHELIKMSVSWEEIELLLSK